MPSVTNFCSELTGDVLTACKSIPESCVSLNTPPFSQIVGEPELFIRIKKVIQEASLGTHRFFVLGPGRGTTATHEAAKASSLNRKTVHWTQVYADGKILGKTNGASIAARGVMDKLKAFMTQLKNSSVMEAYLSYSDNLRLNRADARSSSTSILWTTLEQGLRSILWQNVTALFDSPWVNLFSELYLAMCTRGVRVVFSTRNADAWARSRIRDHPSGFVCPFAPDVRLLDPFSWTQCAAFARRYAPDRQSAAGDANSTAAPQEAPPRRLPGTRAACRVDDLTPDKLGAAMEKYNAYVRRLVPDDLLLEADFFSSSLIEPKQNSNVSPRDEWTRLEMMLIEAFTRDG